MLWTFLLGWSPFAKENYTKNFKRVQQQARLPRLFKSLFHCFVPCSIALHFVLASKLSNSRPHEKLTVLYVLACTALQMGRAVTSLFHDVTIELYARFQSVLPPLLSMVLVIINFTTSK